MKFCLSLLLGWKESLKTPLDLQASSTNKPVTFDWLNSFAKHNLSIISWISSLGKNPILFLCEGIIINFECHTCTLQVLHYIWFKSTNFVMHILILPAGFILWYLAYEAKPTINDEVTLYWEEKNTNKRNKLLNIINESF